MTLKVDTDTYLNNKTKIDKKAALFGTEVEPVDQEDGYTPITKYGKSNLDRVQQNIQSRFSLNEADSDNEF